MEKHVGTVGFFHSLRLCHYFIISENVSIVRHIENTNIEIDDFYLLYSNKF